LQVYIRYFHPLRKITGIAEDKVRVDKDTTIEDLLGILSKQYGEEFERYVHSGVKQKGLPVIFLLNGKNVLNLEGLKTKLCDDCTLTMMPPIAGG
jgi:MoaD family protein